MLKKKELFTAVRVSYKKPYWTTNLLIKLQEIQCSYNSICIRESAK